MKKSFLILPALLLFITLHAFGQSTKSVVKLKNGVVLRGEIVEFNQGDYLVIRVIEGQDMRISYDYIKSFKVKDGKFREYTVPEKGYFNYTYGGLLFLKGNSWDWLEANLTFHTVNGYRLNKKYYGGMGIGLDRYGTLTALPVYASLRTDFSDAKVSPTLNANFGYGFMWESTVFDDWENYNDVKGGFYYEIGAGIRVNYKKTALIFNYAYKHQDSELTIVNEWWWRAEDIVVEHHKFRNMVLTVGLEF
jgi:hypothetical protein